MKNNILYVTINIVLYKPAKKENDEKERIYGRRLSVVKFLFYMSNKENLEMRYLILSPTSLCVDLLRRIWKIKKKSSNNRLELLNLLVYVS